ncbi:MAG: hypothetical protein ACOX9B_15325 [Candidatus Xenobium sp.]|jgi:hypothetical protein|nr:hypothetical protein [Burkholderiales bacterium]
MLLPLYPTIRAEGDNYREPVLEPRRRNLNPPPGVRTEAIEAGLDARKACVLRSGA